MAEQDQLRVTIALLLQERHRFNDIAQLSMDVEEKLIQDWQADPESPSKYERWDQQRNISKEAIERFEKANAAYLEACRKLSK